MDIAKCKALKQRCAAMEEPTLVDIDEFFDGNDDLGSIGCNLTEHPGIETFHSILSAVKKTADVKEVLARISEVDPGEESWPFADTVYVFGDIDLDALRTRVEPLEPTEVSGVGFMAGAEEKRLAKAKNAKLSVIWWD